MKNLGLEFWFHYLAVGAMVDEKGLRKALMLARQHKVAGIELPWLPLMRVGPETVAWFFREYKITAAALCCFFGDIDPLSKQDMRKALESLEGAAVFANNLRGFGLYVPVITGPWPFQIGKEYDLSPARLRRQIVSFVKEVAKIGRKYNLVFCLECLREKENHAIKGTIEALSIVREVNSKFVRLHVDTFHMNLWHEDLATVPSQVGKWIGWYHASDILRYTPGNTPHKGINWDRVAKGIQWNRECGGELKCVCFEGFSPAFRKMVPAIGGEFPRDLLPEKAIPLARKTLKRAKIIK